MWKVLNKEVDLGEPTSFLDHAYLGWASWFLVSMYLIWILESRLIRSNSQSSATLWVLETCLNAGLLPFMIILITGSLSSNTYSKASWREDWTFEGTESIFSITLIFLWDFWFILTSTLTSCLVLCNSPQYLCLFHIVFECSPSMHDLAKIWASCVSVDVSKYLDISILEFSIICEHLPVSLGYEQTLCQLLVLRNQAVWRWYPWLLLLSFVMLMILVQWILHKTPNRLLQYHLVVQLDLCIFGALPPIQHFQMTYVHQWGEMNFYALRPCFIDHLWIVPDFCYVPRRNLFVKFHPFFFHCCFCCWNFHSLRHRNEFVYQIVKLQWIVTSFLQYGLHDDSVKVLPYAVLWIHWLPKYTQVLFLILLGLPLVTTCWLFLLVLQGMAGATNASNFLRAFLMVLFEFLVLRVNEIDS